MVRLLLSVGVFVACAAVQAEMPDIHLQEAGSAAVLAHSTFAHGYRHGYEEGYHAGNTDINMGRRPRAKLSEIRDLKAGYSSEFGPRRIFDDGFQAGLRIGYSDGYLGRNFRAVDTLRAVASSLERSPFPADPTHKYFDQGFLTGYNDGFGTGGSDQASAAEMDFHHVGCRPFHPASKGDLAAEDSYCEGYRRGFALGHSDGFLLRPESHRMEASK